MRRISSRATFVYKRIFPLVFVGILVVFVTFLLLGGQRTGQTPPWPAFVIPVLVFAFIFYVMKKLVFDMVDEVLDVGDALVVRNRGREERIALSEVMNVNYSPFMSPPRVVLSLRRSSIFGSQVAFCAPLRFVPFATSPIIDELIQRIDAARRR